MGVQIEKPRVSIFVSYAHENKVWMRRLSPILDSMQNDDCGRGAARIEWVSFWHDQELRAGDEWDKQIRAALEQMRVFVPLVSMEYFASSYIADVELPTAQQRHNRGEIFVVPILLYDINLARKSGFLSQFNPLPAWNRSWSKYRARYEAFRAIDDGLWDVISRALVGTAKRL